jgi:hypothetical protein
MTTPKNISSKAKAAALMEIDAQLQVLIRYAQGVDCRYGDGHGHGLRVYVSHLTATAERYGLEEQVVREALDKIYGALVANKKFSVAAALAKQHNL